MRGGVSVMLRWIRKRFGRRQACICEKPVTLDQLHCDICGYSIIERTKADVARRPGPA